MLMQVILDPRIRARRSRCGLAAQGACLSLKVREVRAMMFRSEEFSRRFRRAGTTEHRFRRASEEFFQRTNITTISSRWSNGVYL